MIYLIKKKITVKGMKIKVLSAFLLFSPIFYIIDFRQKRQFSINSERKENYLPQISNQSHTAEYHMYRFKKKSLYSNSKMKFKSGHIPQLLRHHKKKILKQPNSKNSIDYTWEEVPLSDPIEYF